MLFCCLQNLQQKAIQDTMTALLKLASSANLKGAVKMAQIYGYARVSSREQNEARQLVAMREFGISENNIFLDKISGKDFERPAYKRLLKKLKPGDTLVIKSIDRLGRDYDEILEQWRIITKEKEIAIVVLDIPLLDTRQKDRDLTGTFIADLVLQLLSYVAQTEREFIHQRQAEGIEAAKAKGTKFGRPPLEKPEMFLEVMKSWKRSEISAREAGRRLGVNHMTFQAWVSQNN
jgi:DNA invertase Pin-like site-specific DNA recombinase